MGQKYLAIQAQTRGLMYIWNREMESNNKQNAFLCYAASFNSFYSVEINTWTSKIWRNRIFTFPWLEKVTRKGHCGLLRVMRIYNLRRLDSVRFKSIGHNTDRIVGLQIVTFKWPSSVLLQDPFSSMPVSLWTCLFMTANSVLYIYRVSQVLRSILRDLIPELMVNTKELLQWILIAARIINNAAALLKLTNSLVKRVRKFIHVDGGHLVKLSWVANSHSVTVHLTTCLNKHTVIFLSFLFIYSTSTL